MEQPVVVCGRPDEGELAVLIAVLGILARRALVPQGRMATSAAWRDDSDDYTGANSWKCRGEFRFADLWMAERTGAVRFRYARNLISM